MLMYNLIEYSDNYSKTSGCLRQYYRVETAMTDNGAIKNFYVNGNNSASFKFKKKNNKCNSCWWYKNVEIIVSLKYLSNFWRTLEMPLINCENNLILTWSEKCVLSNATKAATFAVTDTKLHVSVVTLSTLSSNCGNKRL